MIRCLHPANASSVSIETDFGVIINSLCVARRCLLTFLLLFLATILHTSTMYDTIGAVIIQDLLNFCNAPPQYSLKIHYIFISMPLSGVGRGYIRTFPERLFLIILFYLLMDPIIYLIIRVLSNSVFRIVSSVDILFSLVILPSVSPLSFRIRPLRIRFLHWFVYSFV